MIKNVIWDWNGTLLNDMDVCIESMNIMLKKRNLKTLNLDSYREKFCFPVKQYYQAIGFNFEEEPFAELAKEFIVTITRLNYKCHIFDDVIDKLIEFKKKGIRQIIISASEEKTLLKQVKECNIDSFFYEILGLDNFHAHSKADIALEYIKKKNIESYETVWIGDTLHDSDIAESLNMKPILINRGHQNIKGIDLSKKISILSSIKEIDLF